MIRIYKNILLYFIIFTCLPGLFSKKSPAWNAPLKQAPELTHGILPNGMHYYIYPHASPKGFISLRLMVNAGAAMENETNDGIAHFIEHMTFNGTKNFKPGTLIHYFQDNGMGFAENDFDGLFEPYVQVDKTNKKNFIRSLSLGTANVLLKKINGVMWVESEVMKGTSFNIIIPVEKYESRVYDDFEDFYSEEE